MSSDLKTAIRESLRAAVKSRDRDLAGVLRLVTAEIKNAEIEKRTELDDDSVLTVLGRMVKQRRSSVEEFSTAGRADLANKEQGEIEVIESFLPQQMSSTEIEAAVVTEIEKLNEPTMKDMGKLMGELSKKLAGRADMSAVSVIVQARLQS